MTSIRELLLVGAAVGLLVPGNGRAAEAAERLQELVESLRQRPLDSALQAQVKAKLLDLPEPKDADLLVAPPITPARMELIWVEPKRLQNLAAEVRGAGGRRTTVFYDSADNDRREIEILETDIRWAQGVEKVVDFAYEAGQAGRLEASIRFYKLALVLAPGGDLFLMSIGVAFVQLGQKERGLRFLEYAARLSPKNGRIQRNLQAARKY